MLAVDQGSLFAICSMSEFASIKTEAGRFDGVTRPYTEQDVARLRGSVQVEHTLARLGAEKFWKLLHTEPFVPALGALSGNQVRGERLHGEPLVGAFADLRQ